MLSENRFEACVQAWLVARDDLGISVVSPFEVAVKGKRTVFVAFLPDFGSPKGIFVYPVVTLSACDEWQSILDWATGEGSYVSFIQVNRYSQYNRRIFVESLSDWGYFGADQLRPTWLSGE